MTIYINKKVISIIIVLIVTGVLFFILNFYTPLFADDYYYSFSCATREPIESVMDIVESQIAHYSSINGRFVTHFLLNYFCFWANRYSTLLMLVFSCYWVC